MTAGPGSMTRSEALPALSPDQVLPLLRERQGAWLQRSVDLVRLLERMNPALRRAILQEALERIERKAAPVLAACHTNILRA